MFRFGGHDHHLFGPIGLDRPGGNAAGVEEADRPVEQVERQRSLLVLGLATVVDLEVAGSHRGHRRLGDKIAAVETDVHQEIDFSTIVRRVGQAVLGRPGNHLAGVRLVGFVGFVLGLGFSRQVIV